MEIKANLKRIKDIKDECKDCINRKRGDVIKNDTPFIDYHKKLNPDDSRTITYNENLNPKRMSDLKSYFNAILLEKKYLKEFLEKKGVDMKGVTFSQYPSKICDELVLDKKTSIQIYQTSVYEGWTLYFRVIDENGVRIKNQKVNIKFLSLNKAYEAKYNSGIEAYTYTIPSGVSTQNITVSYSGSSGYKASSRTVKLTIKSPLSVSKQPTSLANDSDCPEKKNGVYTKWRAWDRLKPKGLSTCGYMSKTTKCTSSSCPAISGKNGTHNTPSNLKVNFEGMGNNMLKIKTTTFSFKDSQYPKNTYINSSGTTPVPQYTKANASYIKAGKVSFKGITKNVNDAPTICGTDKKDAWNSESFSFGAVSVSSDSNFTVSISWTSNTNTNPGELWIKDIKMTMTYIPKQTTPTKTTNFTM